MNILSTNIDLTIDQLSGLLGVKKNTLRYWERIFGVPVKRSPGNRREYPADTVKTMERIRNLFMEGYAVEGVKKRLTQIPVFVGAPPDPSCIDPTD